MGRQHSLATIWKIAKIGGAILSGAAILFGLVTGVDWFLPSVSASPPAPLNPADPFSTPFIVTNNGHLALRSVEVSCYLTNATYTDDVVFSNTRFHYSNTSMMKVKKFLLSADASLVVEYRPYWAPWIHNAKNSAS
jgi:hypothetical protein